MDVLFEEYGKPLLKLLAIVSIIGVLTAIFAGDAVKAMFDNLFTIMETKTGIFTP